MTSFKMLFGIIVTVLSDGIREMGYLWWRCEEEREREIAMLAVEDRC